MRSRIKIRDSGSVYYILSQALLLRTKVIPSPQSLSSCPSLLMDCVLDCKME